MCFGVFVGEWIAGKTKTQPAPRFVGNIIAWLLNLVCILLKLWGYLWSNFLVEIAADWAWRVILSVISAMNMSTRCQFSGVLPERFSLFWEKYVVTFAGRTEGFGVWPILFRLSQYTQLPSRAPSVGKEEVHYRISHLWKCSRRLGLDALAVSIGFVWESFVNSPRSGHTITACIFVFRNHHAGRLL